MRISGNLRLCGVSNTKRKHRKFKIISDSQSRQQYTRTCPSARLAMTIGAFNFTATAGWLATCIAAGKRQVARAIRRLIDDDDDDDDAVSGRQNDTSSWSLYLCKVLVYLPCKWGRNQQFDDVHTRPTLKSKTLRPGWVGRKNGL